MPRPIHHTFGPHVDRSFLWKTLALSYAPRHYVRGLAPHRLRKALQDHFGADPALFASGRESILALLKALKLKPGEEIIVQGFTCVVVPNAIHAAGGVPVYADIDPETLNLTQETVRPLLSPRTRAILCQHTFGIPSSTEMLKKLCEEKNIFLIEDLAHVIPNEKSPKGIGALGDFIILSFGRDKAISGIAGGSVLSRHPAITSELLNLERMATHVSWWETAKLLEYPTRMYSIVRPLSGTPFFRAAIWLLKNLKMNTPILSDAEKKGYMSPVLRKIPNVCASLALYSLQKLKKSNERRRTLTSFFHRHGTKHRWPMLRGMSPDLPLQKFPLFVRDAANKRAILQKENIHLNDGWTGCVICPDSVTLSSSGYEWGHDPEAEKASVAVLCLPTHPTMTLYQAEKLARRIDALLKAERAEKAGTAER